MGTKNKIINWKCKFKITENEENSKSVTFVISNRVNAINFKGIEMGRW